MEVWRRLRTAHESERRGRVAKTTAMFNTGRDKSARGAGRRRGRSKGRGRFLTRGLQRAEGVVADAIDIEATAKKEWTGASGKPWSIARTRTLAQRVVAERFHFAPTASWTIARLQHLRPQITRKHGRNHER
jgi:hypothetical protein